MLLGERRNLKIYLKVGMLYEKVLLPERELKVSSKMNHGL